MIAHRWYRSLLLLLFLPFFLLLRHSCGEFSPPATDMTVLLDLKRFLLSHNSVNRGPYASWNESDPSPCRWSGISCTADGRVAGIDLSSSTISGELFPRFFLLPALSHLDISFNSINGSVPPELGQCRNLRRLNLSSNFLEGELNLTSLNLLQTLDVSFNRFVGQIGSSFPLSCGDLVSLNISNNNFSGEIGDYLDRCRRNLRFLDLSFNRFGFSIWIGFWWLNEFLAQENGFMGEIPAETFPSGCNLANLDLSGNGFNGSFPGSIGNCSKMTALNLWGNYFTGRVPSGIGFLSELGALLLGRNSFHRELPVELLHCRKLLFLDLSGNGFRGVIQSILGNFSSLEFLLLHSNNFVGGIEESGVLTLPNLVRLDLSANNFSMELPVSVSQMPKLELLMLSGNDFYGRIPPEYGRIATLQALDLSSNRLSGRIPPEIGNLTSLLWLNLANNNLAGEIPPEIRRCSSLLWLNLANNRLSGQIPPEISEIGRNPSPTFNKNRVTYFGSGECPAMKRWLPATYPPFSFAYAAMTRRNCRSAWDRLFRGRGVFPVCMNASNPVLRTLDVTGYLQLSGNLLSGQIPPSIGRMRRLSILSLDSNNLSGDLPASLGLLPLVLLNVSGNAISGALPAALGEIRCLQILDLSRNNFSGELPAGLNALSDLSRFNLSFNPLVRGVVPSSGQISTFDNRSFVGDPLIAFSTVDRRADQGSLPAPTGHHWTAWIVSLWVILPVVSVIFLLSVFLCFVSPSSDGSGGEGFKQKLPPASSGGVRVFCLDDKATFTYADIVEATGNFSAHMIIGCGGSGVVYLGELSGGLRVAVKKLRREDPESERAFRAEMEILAGGHPNLVSVFGWCLAGSEKLIVYEYVGGGSLEEVVRDRRRFGWAQRVEAANGVARALAHLHHECVPAVVHRDVKASNVMMDGRGRTKMTDFGLARTVVSGETHVSTVVAGTVGYVAPEYGQTWRATTKGDVYSFGVLVMELATGRRAVEEGGEECLVDWLRRVGPEEAMKGAMEGWGEEGGEAMRGLMRIGMSCTEEAPQARPDMKEVLQMLTRIVKGDDSDWDCGLDNSFQIAAR